MFSLLSICFALLFGELTAQDVPKKNVVITDASKPEEAGMSAERLKRIDDKMNEWLKADKMQGCGVLIVRNGKIAYYKAYGHADERRRQAMRTDHIFRIASQTKAITSVAVMMLYEEGRFLLDDPVGKYLPEFEEMQVLDKFQASDSSFTTVPARSKITIRQLLTHTSGIGYAQIGSQEFNAIAAKADITAGAGVEKGRMLAKDMKKLARLPLMHQPGEQWTYGLNADLLGYLVEVVSGMSLDAFFKKRIFEPLGMNDTYFYLPRNKRSRLVAMFGEENGKLKALDKEIQYNGTFRAEYPANEGTYFSGGSGLSSTLMDYAIFLQMILNGGEYNGKRILSKNSVRMMTMNQIGKLSLGSLKFGLGFNIVTEEASALMPTPEGVFVGMGSFATTFWADPKENLIGLFYRQLWGSSHQGADDIFQVLTYQAIAD